MPVAINIEGVVREYQGSDKRRFRAVDGLDLAVEQGETLAFLGPTALARPRRSR